MWTRPGSPTCPTSGARSPARSPEPATPEPATPEPATPEPATPEPATNRPRSGRAYAAGFALCVKDAARRHDELAVVVQQDPDAPGDNAAGNQIHRQVAVQDEEEVELVRIVMNPRD